MALSSPLQVLDLLLGNRDARQMRDAADGGGVDGHGDGAPCWRPCPAGIPASL